MTYKWLAWPAYKTLSSNRYRNKKAFIITGITQELANDHILRLKNMFMQYYPGALPYLEYTQKTLTLNEALFRAYPQANPEAPRGKTDVFFILADEFDFPNRRIQEDQMAVITPFRPKADAYIVLNSTTKRVDGLYIEWDEEWRQFLDSLNIPSINQYDLLQDPMPQYLHTIKAELRHRYFLLEFDVAWGIGKIYTQEEIREVEQDRTYPSEFLNKYGGTIGNVFPQWMVRKAEYLGELYKDLPINQGATHLGSCDPGFSKTTPIYIGELDKEHEVFRIIWWKRMDNAVPSEVAKVIWEKHKEFLNLHWLLDASNRGFVNEVKFLFGESQKWNLPSEVSHHSNRILPVNFGSAMPSPDAKKKGIIEGHEMLLEHLHSLMSKEKVAVPKECKHLILSLDGAYATGWDLDKDETPHDDDLDCLRMMTKMVKIT